MEILLPTCARGLPPDDGRVFSLVLRKGCWEYFYEVRYAVKLVDTEGCKSKLVYLKPIFLYFSFE